jgi:glucose-6-phosphate 1-dehydrogenase
MRFSYEAAFGKSSANGYERLLLDAMLGDATLFSHRDGVEAACAFHPTAYRSLAGRRSHGFLIRALFFGATLF